MPTIAVSEIKKHFQDTFVLNQLIKKCFLIICITLLHIVYCQSQILYSYQAPSKCMLLCRNHEIGSDNYLLYKMQKNPSSNLIRENKIMVINPTGRVTRTFDLDSNILISSIVSDTSNYYCLANVNSTSIFSPISYTSCIIKYDKNFNKVQTTNIETKADSNYLWGVKLILKNNKLFGAITYEKQSPNLQQDTGYICELDLNLNLLHKEMINGRIEDFAMQGNNFICSLSRYQPPPFSSAFAVRQLDSNYQFVNEIYMNDVSTCTLFVNNASDMQECCNLHEINKRKYVAIGSVSNSFSIFTPETQIAAAFIQDNNSTINKVNYGKPYYHCFTQTRINASSNRFNNIYVLALATNISNYGAPLWIPSPYATELSIAKIDTSGIIKWSKFYGGDKFYFPQSIFATRDSGAIICGLRYDTLNPAVPYISENFILKINKNGTEEALNVLENGLKKIQVSVFPNPSKENIYFDFGDSELAELRIYDLKGNLIYEHLAYAAGKQINLNNLKAATYFYTIKLKNRIGQGKFIKD